MKKTLIAAATAAPAAMLVMLLLVVSALSTSAVAAPVQLFGNNTKKDTTRLLTGKVLDASDNPVPNAVVYLTDTHTRSVKTYIVGDDGTYRFPALQPTIDYEVYAQYDNHKSGTKTVSQFEDRTQVYISLKINTKVVNKSDK